MHSRFFYVILLFIYVCCLLCICASSESGPEIKSDKLSLAQKNRGPRQTDQAGEGGAVEPEPVVGGAAEPEPVVGGAAEPEPAAGGAGDGGEGGPRQTDQTGGGAAEPEPVVGGAGDGGEGDGGAGGGGAGGPRQTGQADDGADDGAEDGGKKPGGGAVADGGSGDGDAGGPRQTGQADDGAGDGGATGDGGKKPGGGAVGDGGSGDGGEGDGGAGGGGAGGPRQTGQADDGADDGAEDGGKKPGGGAVADGGSGDGDAGGPRQTGQADDGADDGAEDGGKKPGGGAVGDGGSGDGGSGDGGSGDGGKKPGGGAVGDGGSGDGGSGDGGSGDGGSGDGGSGDGGSGDGGKKPGGGKKPDGGSGNTSVVPTTYGITRCCPDGLVLQIWRPLDELTMTDIVLRGIVYFLAMMYLFLGIAIVSDRFMAAIEVITSSERKISVTNSNGEKEITSVRVWNETAANLTLMALGSSAPEILLAIIEMFQKNFEAGDLGPGTIVGSAAYNLFIIIAVCIVIIPKGQVRRIKHQRVFLTTAFYSVFAYIWMYLILAVISPDRIEIWEGLVTFSLFGVTVYHAYVAEKRILCYKFLERQHKKEVALRKKRSLTLNRSEAANKASLRRSTKRLAKGSLKETDLEETRTEYINTLKELRRKYPHYELDRLEAMAQEHLIKTAPKSRAFYRIQATRILVGSGKVMQRITDHAIDSSDEVKTIVRAVTFEDEDEDGDVETRIYFEPGFYTVMESCGEFSLRVVRRGNLSYISTVEYYTEDGSAVAGNDYVAKSGTLTFAPGIDEQEIKITIINDDVYEQEEHFYVHLNDPTEPAVLVEPKVATVMVLDDDHCGIFGFEEESYNVPETVGTYSLKVRRFFGARSTIHLPYRTEDGTAVKEKDYYESKGELIFGYGEVEKFILVPIIEENSYERNAKFYVILGEPYVDRADSFSTTLRKLQNKSRAQLTESEQTILMGAPKLSDLDRVELIITESEEFKQSVDKLVKAANASLLIGTTSWKEQITDTFTMSGGDTFLGDEDDDNDDERETYDYLPGPWNYAMHFLTIFWKVCFSIIPPAKLHKGYPCFFVSVFLIIITTAVLGDVASHFGCIVGLKDAVTAISLVACGTSMPDTFASMVAAQHDDSADNSIGNVTGSNAVNVFLGIGIAWSMAAIYHHYKGNVFVVKQGAMAFSITIFLIEAIIAIGLILYRRKPPIGGELGGPTKSRWIHFSILVALWILYLVLSGLQAYDIIPGF